MLAARDRLKEFKFYFPLYIILAKIRRSDLHLVEFVSASLSPLDLTLVDWCVLTERHVAVDDEEAEAALAQLSNGVEHDDLAVGICSLLLP